MVFILLTQFTGNSQFWEFFLIFAPYLLSNHFIATSENNGVILKLAAKRQEHKEKTEKWTQNIRKKTQMKLQPALKAVLCTMSTA